MWVSSWVYPKHLGNKGITFGDLQALQYRKTVKELVQQVLASVLSRIKDVDFSCLENLQGISQINWPASLPRTQNSGTFAPKQMNNWQRRFQGVQTCSRRADSLSGLLPLIHSWNLSQSELPNFQRQGA